MMPARSAATAGASGSGRLRSGCASTFCSSEATASTSESDRSAELMPVSTGLKPIARTPRERNAVTNAAAIIVLPTPVSVPVTRRSRTESLLDDGLHGRCEMAKLGIGCGQRWHQHHDVAEWPKKNAAIAERKTEVVAVPIAGCERRFRRTIR